MPRRRESLSAVTAWARDLLCAPSMGPCVLVALPKGTLSWVIEALRSRFEVKVVSRPARARAFLLTGCFQAVVTVEGFLDGDEAATCQPPIVCAPDDSDPHGLVTQVEQATAEHRTREREKAAAVTPLAELTYREFADLTRYRDTRQYLLALVHAHQGSVTEA